MSLPAAATTTVPLVPVLKDIIWERFAKALDVKRRLYVVRAFADELDRTKRGKPFRMRNDIAWLAMLDLRDKLVIDLHSLTVEMRHGIRPSHGRASKEFMAKRGLFIDIRDHHVASLTRTYVPHADDDEYEIDYSTASRAEKFARLFPGCTTESPSPADIENLCERFRLRMEPLAKDRHKNRAHAYEGDLGTAKMLWVPELEALFDYVEEMLEDLSLVSAGACFASQDMNQADCKETAVDMVDLILLGNFKDVRQLTETRTRDELYDLLHQIHDADEPAEPGDVPQLHFNDCQFAPPFVDWHAAVAARVSRPPPSNAS
jgi:hypothetical protein